MRYKYSQGYTLVELMVAITVFLTVSTITIGSFVRMVNAHYRMEALRSALDGMSLVMEDMTRSVREGTTYHCDLSVGSIDSDRSCIAAGADSFAYEPVHGATTTDADQIRYRRSVDANGRGYIERYGPTEPTGTYAWETLTSPRIDITRFAVYVEEADSGANIQPHMLVVVSGSAGENAARKVSFTLQSTITQRSPNI